MAKSSTDLTIQQGLAERLSPQTERYDLKEIESALSGKAGRVRHIKDSLHNRIFSEGDVFENAQMCLDLFAAENLVLRLCATYESNALLFETVRAETHAPQHLYLPGYETRFKSPTAFLPNFAPSKRVKIFERGDPDHILWLMFSALTDRRQKSGGPFGVYASHCRIYANRPECYTKKVMSFDPVEFGNYLKKFKIGVPNQSAAYWIRCAKTLFGSYGGDPVRMFREIGTDVRAVQAFKKSGEVYVENGKKKRNDPLPGFGPKITSLYSLFLHEVGAVLMPEDAFPVDVQVQRMFLQTGVIIRKMDISNAMMEKVLRPLICLVAKFYQLDKVIVSHSFWLLGSELCNGCPDKQIARYKCPVYEACLGCENTASYFARGKWAIDDKPMNKGGMQKIEFGMPGVTPHRYGRIKRLPSTQELLWS